MDRLTALMTLLVVSLLLHTLAATEQDRTDDDSLVDIETNYTSDVILSCDISMFGKTENDLIGYTLTSLQLIKIGREETTKVLAKIGPHSEDRITVDPLYLFKDRLLLEGHVDNGNKYKTYLRLALPNMWPSEMMLGRYICNATFQDKAGTDLMYFTRNFTVRENDTNNDISRPFAVKKGLTVTCKDIDKSRAKLEKTTDTGIIIKEDCTTQAGSQRCPVSKNSTWFSDFSTYPQRSVHIFYAEPRNRKIDCITPSSEKSLNLDAHTGTNKGAPSQSLPGFFIAASMFMVMISSSVFN